MKYNLDYNRLYDLYSKYLKNNCSKEEAAELLKILEDPDNDQFIKTIAFKSWDEINDDGQINDQNKRIMYALDHKAGANKREPVKKHFLENKLNKLFIRTAAVLFIPLMLYSIYLTLNIRNKKIDHILTQTIEVPSGVRTNLSLPDGSHVWLNSGSVFKYPTSFNGRLREVELTGEAYFDIARDPDHPFIVRTGLVDIEVRGTKFNVINYLDDPQIEVILESGEVRLFYESNNKENSILLSEPGEKGVYDKSLRTTTVKRVDIDKYTLWKNGILIFRDDPMNEVVRKLSHKFNADIKLQSPAINEYVYTATFIDESLIQILELLKMSAPLDYTIMNQKKLDDNTYSRLEIIIDKTNK